MCCLCFYYFFCLFGFFLFVKDVDFIYVFVNLCYLCIFVGNFKVFEVMEGFLIEIVLNFILIWSCE